MPFGIILQTSDTLPAGKSAVFTIAEGRVFEYNSSDWVLSNLRDRISNFGDVVSVSRGLFSDRYVINVLPNGNYSLSDWISVFDSAFKDMGYNNATFWQAEGDVITSSAAGGITQAIGDILPSASSIVGSTVTSALKPLLPYILVGIAVFALIQVSPQFLRGRD